MNKYKIVSWYKDKNAIAREDIEPTVDKFLENWVKKGYKPLSLSVYYGSFYFLLEVAN